MTFQKVEKCFFNHGWTKRAITMKYTVHSVEMVDVSKRFYKLMKLECVVDYKASMRGVDSAHQYLSLYLLMRNTSM